MRIEDKIIELEGHNVKGKLVGTGDKDSLVIIAHGFGGKAAAFMPLAKELSEEHDVYLYAQRGHGFSDGLDKYRRDLMMDGDRDSLLANMTLGALDTIREFDLKQAIADHRIITQEMSKEYEKIGYFGFSTGATIAAKAAEKEDIDAQYLASPFLNAKDIRTPIARLKKVANALGDPAFEDVELREPYKIAIAEEDNRLHTSQKFALFQDRYVSNQVEMFKGDHVFNPGKDELYFGRHEGKRHDHLYDDIILFFRENLKPAA